MRDRDYEREPDPSFEPFEVMRRDTLLTESTFGLPLYAWPDANRVFDAMNDWWRINAAAGRTTVFLACAFDKARRVLAGLDASISARSGSTIPSRAPPRSTGKPVRSTGDVARRPGNRRDDRRWRRRDLFRAGDGHPRIRRFTGPGGSAWARSRAGCRSEADVASSRSTAAS